MIHTRGLVFIFALVCVPTNRNISITVTTVICRGFNHKTYIPCSTDREKTQHARHPTRQLVPVERPVHTQSSALSHPPQRPRKCLAEILESFSRSRYAFLYTHSRDDQERDLALRMGRLFFNVSWLKTKTKKGM